MSLKYRVEIEEVVPEEGSSAVVVELIAVVEIVAVVVVETMDVAEVEEEGIVSQVTCSQMAVIPMRYGTVSQEQKRHRYISSVKHEENKQNVKLLL